MFLLLTYLLFRRPASAAPGRYPTELNMRVRHSVYLKEESPVEKAVAASRRRRLNESILWSVALGLALILPSGALAMAQTPADAQEEMRQMRQLIERLESRINQLEAEKSAAAVKPALPAAEEPNTTVAAPSATPTPEQTSASSEGSSKASNFFRDTTISGTVDGYYGYNFNRPVGRISLLRAYDVASNSFSLNQAVISVERAPDVDAGRRFGMRLDLMYGQATETVQGNAANEPRPQVYRPLWQVYGTYAGSLDRCHPAGTERQISCARHLRDMAGNGQVDAGGGGRLRDQPRAGVLLAIPCDGRRRVRAIPVHAEVRPGRTRRVSLGSRRPFQRSHTGSEGDDIDG
jgi:hypothetical protein